MNTVFACNFLQPVGVETVKKHTDPTGYIHVDICSAQNQIKLPGRCCFTRVHQMFCFHFQKESLKKKKYFLCTHTHPCVCMRVSSSKMTSHNFFMGQYTILRCCSLRRHLRDSLINLRTVELLVPSASAWRTNLHWD